MTPKIKSTKKKIPMSQYNATFNLHYDTLLKELTNYLYQKGTIDSDSKYGLAYYSILRTLFDYIDEIVEDYLYTPEQLVALIEEHEILKNKFEQKLLNIAEIKQDKINKVILEIEDE